MRNFKKSTLISMDLVDNMIKQLYNEIVQIHMEKINNINILQIYFLYKSILEQILLHVVYFLFGSKSLSVVNFIIDFMYKARQ